MFDQAKERGLGKNKRKWIIMINKARNLYLNMHFKIDCVYHLIQNSKFSYRTCKYWHSLMSHVKALDVVVAYYMYIECADGELKESWNIREPMTYWEFRDNLSDQILTYNPKSFLYGGDENMRVSVAQISNHKKMGKPKKDNGEKNTINFNTSKRAQNTRHNTGRLCGDL